MNISFAILLWMIGAKLNMGYAYFICICIFTLLHYIKFPIIINSEKEVKIDIDDFF